MFDDLTDLYQQVILDHSRSPRNFHRLENATCTAQGHNPLSDMVAGVHAQFPGHRFRRVSGIDTHHGLLRFAWELVGPDDAVAVAGIDVGVVAPDGRLQRIAGFFGELPEQGND